MYRMLPTQLIFLFTILIYGVSSAQSLDKITLEECYEWSRLNYPLIKQLELIDKSSEYSLANASKSYLPQININGQFTYQSDVTSLPISLPNVEVPTVSKDQYKVYAEIYQPLTNAVGVNHFKKEMIANAAVDKQKIEVDLYQLRERVNQVYFGILLLEEQTKQLEILQSDLNGTIEKIDAAIENGISIESDKLLLNAETINVKQRSLEIESNKQAFVAMLSYLIGQEIDVETELERPEPIINEATINRPELKLIELQKLSIDQKFGQISSRFVPNVGLFVQTGMGRPALNFLSDNLDAYYIGGLKMNWSLSSFYTARKEKRMLNLSKDKLQSAKETFLLNTNFSVIQQSNEVNKYEILIGTDKELIELRKSIKETAEVQLSNGLISALDYVAYVNAENTANQNLLLHQLQMLMAQYTLKTTLGN